MKSVQSKSFVDVQYITYYIKELSTLPLYQTQLNKELSVLCLNALYLVLPYINYLTFADTM